MRRTRGRIAVTLVLAFLGFLTVLQLRVQTATPGLTNLSAQELTVLIANLTTRNEQLADEVETLRRQSDALEAGQSRGQTSLGQIRADLDRIRAFTGLVAVRGPGVRVVIDGPLPGEGVALLLNELRNAGGEAIAVEDMRVVPGLVVAGPAGALHIGGANLPARFEIVVIGSPETITGSLTRAGGPIAQLAARFPDAFVEVLPAESLVVPATDRRLVPEHGQPRI